MGEFSGRDKLQPFKGLKEEKIDEGLGSKIKGVITIVKNFGKISQLSKDVKSAITKIDTSNVLTQRQYDDALQELKDVINSTIDNSDVDKDLKPIFKKHFEDKVFKKFA